jgi:hypothetical protein
LSKEATLESGREMKLLQGDTRESIANLAVSARL